MAGIEVYGQCKCSAEDIADGVTSTRSKPTLFSQLFLSDAISIPGVLKCMNDFPAG